MNGSHTITIINGIHTDLREGDELAATYFSVEEEDDDESFIFFVSRSSFLCLFFSAFFNFFNLRYSISLSKSNPSILSKAFALSTR